MQIDWFTLCAQVLNFLVLVWLLKHFLYARIVRAMDEREARIASRLDEAARQRAEAEREAASYRASNRQLDAEREQMLARARELAEARREELVEEARVAAEQARAQWLEALRLEQRALLEELRERMGQQVFKVARRALRDLAGAELEERMLAVFLERLERLEPGEREAIVAALRAADHEVEIRSSFPLTAELRERVVRGLRRQLDESADVRFTTAADSGCGIELRAQSQRLAWNLESYLEGLEEGVFAALDERARDHGGSR